VLEIKEFLSTLVKDDSNLLVIIHTDAKGQVDVDFPIEWACLLEFPDAYKCFKEKKKNG
jgi:hypothetical protein